MIKVGAFEAKTHLSALLDKVSQGEEVLITKRGKAIARLVSAEQADSAQMSDTIDQILALREEITLGDTGWKSLRDEGRR
jgi:prevent-host-death family protein